MIEETAIQDPIDALIEEYASKLRSGSAPPLEEFARSHPSESDELRALLPTVVAMEEVRRRRQSGANVIAGKMPERIGDFQLVREIGRGGMGIVYEALERTLKRRVALKILPGRGPMDALRLQRFQREAQAAGQLHHTNIVPVFGSGEEDGLHYFVMQFIAGRSLHQIVEDSKKRKLLAAEADPGAKTQADAEAARKRDYLRWAAKVILQAADALQYAHSQGIQHRDIKPGNILIDAKDIAWITDFGLAKIAEDDGLTKTGDIIGTLQYMSPESFNGIYDSRGDIYSLGLTLSEILTGQPPHLKSTAAEVINEIMTTELQPPRKTDRAIPEDLETIVLKAAARAPEKRYQTAGEMADDLRRFVEDRPILARKVGFAERTLRWCRRNRTVAALSGVAAAAVLLALAAGWIGYAQTKAALSREGLKAEAARLAEARAQANEMQAEANVEMSLKALEEMFEQLKLSEAPENFQQPFMPEFGDDRPPRAGPRDGHGPPGFFEPPKDGRPRDPNGRDDRMAPPPNAGANGRDGPPPDARGPNPDTARQSAEIVGVVQSVLKFYELFAEKNTTHPTLRLESVHAYERVGELQLRLGKSDKAEEAFRRALKTADELSPLFSDSTDFLSLTVKTHGRLGELLLARKDFDAAAGEFRKAIELQAALAAGDMRYKRELAQLRLYLAKSLTQQKKYDAAIAELQTALQESESDAAHIQPARRSVNTIYRRLAELYKLNGNQGASTEAELKAEKVKATEPNGPEPH